mgnify:FL=1
MFWQDPLIFWSIMVNLLINYQCAVQKQENKRMKQVKRQNEKYFRSEEEMYYVRKND